VAPSIDYRSNGSKPVWYFDIGAGFDDELAHRALGADLREVVVVERRQDRDREDARRSGMAHGGLEHRPAPTGVHRQQLRTEPRNPCGRTRDGLRDVVKLQVEHHAAAGGHIILDDRRSRATEQLQSELVPVRDPGEPGHEFIGLGAARRIDRRDQTVSGIERHALVYAMTARYLATRIA
jgi:hypothetical protein